MAKHNYRLIKLNRSYSITDIVDLLGVHKNTVRNWIKKGLPVVNKKRPILIRGDHLFAFLRNLGMIKKQPCKLHEIFCLKCRKPQTPVGSRVNFHQNSDKKGVLKGTCPICKGDLYRAVNATKLDEFEGYLNIQFALDL